MAVSDDEYDYASHDEDDEREDSDDSGNESSIAGDSFHDDEAGGVTDSAFEDDGVLEEGYRLRRPPGDLEAGFIRMTTHLGAPGIFDPKTMLAFQRKGDQQRYEGLRWKGFHCAVSKLEPRVRPQGSSGCNLSYYRRHEHRSPDHHHPLTIHQLQLARYSICQRAFFLLRRSGIKIAEWNFFSKYTWVRIFGDASGFQDETRVPTYLQTCAFNGFLFPLEADMYVRRIAIRGMFAHRFRYNSSLFEAISHFENIHFGFLKNMKDANGDPVRWKLDFPDVDEDVFPSLEEEMEPYALEAVEAISKCTFLVLGSVRTLLCCVVPLVNLSSPFFCLDKDLYDHLMELRHLRKHGKKDFLAWRDPVLPRKKKAKTPASSAKASSKRKQKATRARAPTAPAASVPKKSSRVNAKCSAEETAAGMLRAMGAGKNKAAATPVVKDLSKEELLALYESGTAEQKKMALATLMGRIPESGASADEVPSRKADVGASTSTGGFTVPKMTPEMRRARRAASNSKVDEVQDGLGELYSCLCDENILVL